LKQNTGVAREKCNLRSGELVPDLHGISLDAGKYSIKIYLPLMLAAIPACHLLSKVLLLFVNKRKSE